MKLITTTLCKISLSFCLLAVLAGCSDGARQLDPEQAKKEKLERELSRISDSTKVDLSNLNLVVEKLKREELANILPQFGGEKFALGKTVGEVKSVLQLEKNVGLLYEEWENERKNNLAALSSGQPKQLKSFWAKDDKELDQEKRELLDYSSFDKRIDRLKKKIDQLTYQTATTRSKTLACKELQTLDGLDRRQIRKELQKLSASGNCKVLQKGVKLKVLRNHGVEGVTAVQTPEGWLLADSVRIRRVKGKNQALEKEFKNITKNPPIFYYGALRPFIELSPVNTTRIDFVKKMIFLKTTEEMSETQAAKTVLREQKRYFRNLSSCKLQDNFDSCYKAKEAAHSMARIALDQTKPVQYDSIAVPCQFYRGQKCP